MIDKKVDEGWKNSVEKEKQSAQQESQPAEGQELEASFPVFISGLAMQALIALGELENPVTKKKQTDLSQARYLIDIIQMLQEKTRDNATEEEKKMLEEMLYQLRMVYIEKTKDKK